MHLLYRDPFVLGTPYIASRVPGQTLAELASTVPVLPPDFAERGSIAVNGETIPPEFWQRMRPKQDTVVTFHVVLAGGGEGGTKQVIGIVAALALAVVTAGISSGALAPVLGASFASGTIGATVLAGVVGLAGSLALSALTSPPTTDIAPEEAAAGRATEAASVDGNLLQANTPVPRVIGTRRVYPPFAQEPVIELVNQDEVVEALYCLAGPHALSDFRLGDAGLEVPAVDTKDVEIEIREGLPTDDPLTIITRQGRTNETNVELSVHKVDPENQNTLDPDVSDPLPVYHSVTTRIAPDENWIHFILGGLMRQDSTSDVLRIPIRIRMKPKDSSTWRYLPEIQYANVLQTQRRLQVRIFWGSAYSDTLVTPPTTTGFVVAYYSVPAQDVVPLGETWYADSYFYDGVGDTYYDSTNPDTSGLLNIALYADNVDIYLDETEWEPGVYDIEVKRGETFRDTSFTNASYDYAGDVLDFYGNIEAGTLPLTRAGLLDRLAMVRLVNIWNEYPVKQAGLSLIALTAKNRRVTKMSCLASGYVLDLPPGRGPLFSMSSSAMSFWSWDSVGQVDDVDVLALIRQDVATSTDSPESIMVTLRGSSSGAGTEYGYMAALSTMEDGSGATDALKIYKLVNGSYSQIASASFAWELDKNFFVRFQAIGTALKVKAWPASLPEPSSWIIETTDSDVSSGYVGMFALATLAEGYCNWFSVGLNGDSAPLPPDIAPVYATDFSEYELGSDPNDWTSRFVDGGLAVVTENINLPYNGQSEAWETFTTTSNPAAHFRDVLTGSINYDPLPEELLDDAGVIAWRQRCAESDFTCDMISEGLEIADLLRVITSTGYARLYRSELWGVIVDRSRANETPVQIFSPRNSSSFTWRKAFTRLPSGFRVNFRDGLEDYTRDQTIILRAGSEGSGARLEQVTYDGMVKKSDVIRRASFDLDQAESRSTFYSFDAPAESLVCRRGSLIGVNHDTLTRHHGYARISDVIVDDGYVTGLVLDSKIQIYYESDILGTFDVLEITDVLTSGIQTSIAIRTTSGNVSVHALSSDTVTGYYDTVEFATPIRFKVNAGSPFDRSSIPDIDVGCLVVSGIAGTEFKRLIVSEVQPKTNLEASLICVDEASDIFNRIFEVTY